MDVLVKRVDKGLPLPEYKTPGAAAMDCLVREDVMVPPRGVMMASLNVALKPPHGHFVFIAARSSLHKRGLMMANSVGIGDEDYAGDGDEYKAPLYNFTDESVEVKRGERIAQMIILPFDRVIWKEVDSLNTKDRGGFGTTGV
jgi:dUTP pyrophosphatase